MPDSVWQIFQCTDFADNVCGIEKLWVNTAQIC